MSDGALIPTLAFPVVLAIWGIAEWRRRRRTGIRPQEEPPSRAWLRQIMQGDDCELGQQPLLRRKSRTRQEGTNPFGEDRG